MKTLLAPEDLATHLRIPKSSVYRLVTMEDLPHTRVGRLIRFDPDEVAEWLATRKRGMTVGSSTQSSSVTY